MATPVLTLLRDATAAARALGLRVRPGAAGVHCVSSHATRRWEVDPRADGVCPVGALILAMQPESTYLDEAAAEVMGGSYPLRDGVWDGLNKTPSGEWMQTNAARVYMFGLSNGTIMRSELLRPAPVRPEVAIVRGDA